MNKYVKKFIKQEKTPQPPNNEYRITGLHVQYYHTCKRELWLHHKGIDIDRSQYDIVRGEEISEKAYPRLGEKEVMVNGRICVDLLNEGSIFEVKKSSRNEKAYKMQLFYYMWYFEKIVGEKKRGVLAIPRENERQRFTLTEERQNKIEDTIAGICRTIDGDIPELEEKPFCSKCHFQELCWSSRQK